MKKKLGWKEREEKKNIIMKEIERREEESEGIDERNRSRDGLKRLEK